MKGSRRTVLYSLVLAGLTILSGCLGGFAGSTPTPEPEQTATYEPPEFDQLRVDNGTLIVNQTYQDEQTEYLEDTDSVRYVKAWRHANQSAAENGSVPDREPVYDTMSFDRWGQIKCEETMMDGILTTLHHNTEDHLSGVDIWNSGSDDQLIVARTTTLDRDGDVVSEPSISYERLDTVTPDTVMATLTFENRTYSCSSDVILTNQTAHLD